MKKKAAFEAAIKTFGPWSSWGRAEHIAYGLIRGVEYSRMERSCNDNPHALALGHRLRDLGAWPEHVVPADGKFRSLTRECYDEVARLVVWVKKEPRVRREHLPGTRNTPQAAQ